MDLIFESPGKNNKGDGKKKMIDNFSSKYDKFYNVTDHTNDNTVETARSNDEELLEMEFQNFNERETTVERPSTKGIDGKERKYLINKQCKKVEFDNIRYFELAKRRATLYDPCSAATLPKMFQTENRMEDVIEDRMRIEGDNLVPKSEKVKEIVEKIKERNEKRKQNKDKSKSFKNTKIAQKLNIISVNLNQPSHQIGKLSMFTFIKLSSKLFDSFTTYSVMLVTF